MRTISALFLAFSLFGCSKGADKSAPPPLDIKGRRIDVLAKFDGYEPKEIPVKPGEQVTLVFTRVTNSDCLAELDIPSKNIKQQLPVNQPVAIPVSFEQPGDVEFICGMQMLRGKIKVQ